MDKGHGPEQERYDFLQENIKEEKTSVGKWLRKVVRVFILGLVLGAAGCIGFFALKPWAEDAVFKNPDQVEITEEPVEDPVVESVQNNPVEIKHTVADYRELQSELSGLIKETEKKVVTISAIAQGDSWLSTNIKKTTGVIVGDNGREFLILTTYSEMKDMQLFRVTFVDGTTHEAVLKQKDANNNLAVFSVSKGDMSAETEEKVVVASFTNTTSVKQGEMVFVVGNPFGYAEGIATGIISSTKEMVERADNELIVLVTDIAGSSKGNGIVFNSFGNVIGLIDKNLLSETGSITIVTVGISQIKDEIELMSNGKNVPYIGILGTIISEETSVKENIPQGLYVKEVEMDSPAMAAGIQSGDIITSIDGEEIISMNGYHKAMMKQEAGQLIRLEGQRIGLENYVGIKFSVTVGVK